jgi:uncharacterized protein
MNEQVLKRMQSAGPKKILACDGGGIRGLMSVEILARIEAQLREQRGKPDLVLADYFDFVCGTSTGAIIAACISAGMSMDRIREFYVDSGDQMFDKASLLKRLRYTYKDEPLAAKLRAELNRALGYADDAPPAVLGDANLRTLLMMVLRNHTSDSPWPVFNNPLGKFNQADRNDCNLNLPLWQLVRASTAAPTFFPPEVVTFAENTPNEYHFVFVDGGVTTYNNPAFLAFQMATSAPYKINWASGADKLLIVSVGTGGAAMARPNLKADDLWLLDHAMNIPSALMNAAAAGWDMACRMLGECRAGGQIDHEIGDMVSLKGGQANWTGAKLFTYLRYDADLTRAGLDAMGLADVDPSHVQMLDSVQFIPEIQRVGQTAAMQVKTEHFAGFE